MRKLVVSVVFIGVIPLAEALTLFGETISTLVLIPLIIILLFALVFVFIIIRDKIRSKSASPASELGSIPDLPPIEDLSLPLGEELPPAEIGIGKKEPAAIAKPQLQNPKIDYMKEVGLLEKELPSIKIEEANNKLNDLIRKFFLDYTGISYSFTFEELEKELKKANKNIVCFSGNLSSMNYSPNGVSKENLTELINEFKDVLTFFKEDSQPITPEFKKEIKKEEKKIDIILKKGNSLIGKDITQAIEKYKAIFDLYNLLPSKEKRIIRPLIMDFYNKLGLR